MFRFVRKARSFMYRVPKFRAATTTRKKRPLQQTNALQERHTVALYRLQNAAHAFKVYHPCRVDKKPFLNLSSERAQSNLYKAINRQWNGVITVICLAPKKTKNVIVDRVLYRLQAESISHCCPHRCVYDSIVTKFWLTLVDTFGSGPVRLGCCYYHRQTLCFQV